jgi:vacuolar-type H+-ATPase subunit H
MLLQRRGAARHTAQFGKAEVRFFEEELQMLAQRNATLNKAVAIRMELSRDECLRLIAEAREKARRDEADILWGARHEGLQQDRQETANELSKILSDMGVTSDLISEAVKKLGEI